MVCPSILLLYSAAVAPPEIYVGNEPDPACQVCVTIAIQWAASYRKRPDYELNCAAIVISEKPSAYDPASFQVMEMILLHGSYSCYAAPAVQSNSR